LIAVFVGGFNLKSGFGIAVDLVVVFIAAAIGVPLVAAVVVLLLTLLRKIPRLAAGVIAGTWSFWHCLGSILGLLSRRCRAADRMHARCECGHYFAWRIA